MPKLRFSDLLPRRDDLPAMLALAVAYAGLAVAGLQWTVTPGAATALWPAAGVAFAALVLGGVRLWPGIVIGRLAAAIIVASPQPWWADFLIGVFTALGAVIPVLLINRVRPLDPRLGSLNDMARLVLLGGLVGSLVSGVPGVAVLAAGGAAVERLPGVLAAWCSGFAVGVLLVAPAVLAWWPRGPRAMPLSGWLHLSTCLLAVTVVSGMVFLAEPFQPVRTWHLFPILVWAALAFSVRGAALALLITSGLAIYSALTGQGPLSELSADPRDRLLVAQQFAAASGVTILVLAAVADERRTRERMTQNAAELRAETEALETLNRTGESIASELQLDSLVQRVTDAGVALTGAEFGAFFYNVLNEQGESYLLYSLSGAPREAFNFGMPRNTAVFHPTFAGLEIVRSDDITKDPRYGLSDPHFGMPKGHLPVRSYLAVPVKSRSGEVIGGLFFGHSETGVFQARAERLITGIAAQAAIAIDNARLYQAAQKEIEERRRAEEHQRLLIHELNHRVKNTLATVQSLAAQTTRSAGRRTDGPDPFLDRLMALSRAHDVLTRESWEGAELSAIVHGAVQPFETGGRFEIVGPDVWLEPQLALALAMALHELATNASKYGALSQAGGRVSVDWSLHPRAGGLGLQLCWREAGGPPVMPPTRRGFGSRLLEKGLAAELNGKVEVEYRPDGLVCTVEATLPEGADES